MNMSIDATAQKSGLKNVNPTLKLGTAVTLMLICIASSNPFTGLFLATAAVFLAVYIGKLNPRRYLRVLLLPGSFVLIGSIALLFEVSTEPNARFYITDETVTHTVLVISRAFGAVSCLCVLSLTTPMPETIAVLRRVRCPALMIDLMYLIYRYIFILLSLHGIMYKSAKSRLGFRDYRTSLRTTGKIYSQLLVRSYWFAGKNFDAMESRGYTAGIRFLERRKRIRFKHITVSMVLIFVTACIGILPL